MALKYGSKSGGFGLRSGNAKGMPFKEMGSSPVHYEINPEKFEKRIAEQKVKDLNSNTPERNLESEAKGRVDKTRGTDPDQVKKSGKLDKIQKRQDEKAYNKYLKKNKMSGDDATRENWKKSDQYTDKESKRETRLKSEVGMTPEEYKANQKAKPFSKEGISGTLDKIGGKFRYLHDVMKGSSATEAHAREQNIRTPKEREAELEKKKIDTARTEQLVNAQKNKDDYKLSSDESLSATV